MAVKRDYVFLSKYEDLLYRMQDVVFLMKLNCDYDIEGEASREVYENNKAILKALEKELASLLSGYDITGKEQE